MKKNTQIVLMILIISSIIMGSLFVNAIKEHRVKFKEAEQKQSLAENNNLYLRIGSCSSYCGRSDSRVEYINGTFDCVCVME